MRGFAIDPISVVPDHVHLLVRIVPRMSIEECALLLTVFCRLLETMVTSTKFSGLNPS